MSEDYEGPIKPDELIGRLVPDPENPDIRRLLGFRLGESDRSGYWRLYLDPDLSEYLEFRKESVLDGEERPDGNTVIWLKPDAKITRIRSQEAALRFLEGDIRSEFLRPTGFAALARAVATGTGTLCSNCCFTLQRGQGGSPV